MTTTIQRYCFNLEFYDQMAAIVRPYQLFFYPEDNSIEMFDLKNKKIFLKRVVYPSLSMKDLYVGSVINIYSRKQIVSDYGDTFTRNLFQETRSSTFGMIKPCSYMNIGKILDYIYNSAQFSISKLKMTKFLPSDAEEFYAEHKGKNFFEGLTQFITSDYIVGMELVQKNALQNWRDCIGPTDSDKARKEAPNSIRALFGTDGRRNAVHGSDSSQNASRELELFFGPKSKLRSTSQLNNCTCLVIKPHAISEGYAGKIIDIVLSNGFEISAMEMFYLNKTMSEEFHEVYKGVLPEYSGMVEQTSLGPIIAMEIRQDDAVNKLRALVGPHDPEIAKQLRPNTLRALFGIDRVRNAVHCTDLTEDGVLEVQYFFELLQQDK